MSVGDDRAMRGACPARVAPRQLARRAERAPRRDSETTSRPDHMTLADHSSIVEPTSLGEHCAPAVEPLDRRSVQLGGRDTLFPTASPDLSPRPLRRERWRGRAPEVSTTAPFSPWYMTEKLYETRNVDQCGTARGVPHRDYRGWPARGALRRAAQPGQLCRQHLQ